MTRAIMTGLIAAAAFLSGCGYALIDSAPAVPAEFRKLYVLTGGERKADPVIVDALARELRRVVRTDGRFSLAERQSEADAILRVEIISSLTRPVAFDEFDDVLDYETTLRIDAALSDGAGELIWQHDRIAASRQHGAVAGAVVTSSSSFQSTERLKPEVLQEFDTVQIGEQRIHHARRSLAEDLARTVYQLMIEGR